MRGDARAHIKIVLGMLAAVALPSAVTLATIRTSVGDMAGVENPTPYSYTVSLLLFLVPILAVSRWHLSRGPGYDRKAFLLCAGFFAVLGSLLDIMFGYKFFQFPNQGATLGIRIPAWDWGNLQFVPAYLPLEEFGFYILGGVFMVSAYLWAEQVWVPQFTRTDYEEAASAHPSLITFNVPLALGWGVVLAAGLAYRAFTQGGIPGYFVFVMVAGVGPTILLIGTVKEFVNWHAMAFAFFSLVFVSVIWEASLGVPYEWWTYRSEAVMGIFIHGWADLPIEAVVVWIVGVWDAVLIYEFLRIFLRMKHPTRHRFFGPPKSIGA